MAFTRKQHSPCRRRQAALECWKSGIYSSLYPDPVCSWASHIRAMSLSFSICKIRTFGLMISKLLSTSDFTLLTKLMTCSLPMWKLWFKELCKWIWRNSTRSESWTIWWRNREGVLVKSCKHDYQAHIYTP